MKDELKAQLKINDLPSMKKKERELLVEWLRKIAKEINKEDPKIYAKNYKAKLYI